MPGPTQDIAFELGFPVVFQLVTIVCGLPTPTGTIKSKLCADSVLKINSKLQSGLGTTHIPVPEPPVGLLHV